MVMLFQTIRYHIFCQLAESLRCHRIKELFVFVFIPDLYFLNGAYQHYILVNSTMLPQVRWNQKPASCVQFQFGCAVKKISPEFTNFRIKFIQLAYTFEYWLPID